MEKKEKGLNRGPDLLGFWTRQISKSKRKRRNNNFGFSLVELIIVIAIMAILAAALAPALIRYIAKSRKAVDIETASVIFEAANLASATSSDEANAGWYIAADTKSTKNVARTWVTPNGHNADIDKSYNRKDQYEVAVVAWARGIDYNGWQNALFKATIDGNVSDQNGNLQKDSLYLTQYFVNEFLSNLFHDAALSESYKGAGKNKYDGKQFATMEFRFKQDAGLGIPECWCLCINCVSFTPEVWIGNKSKSLGGTGSVRPIYRLYPDPCLEYTE